MERAADLVCPCFTQFPSINATAPLTFEINQRMLITVKKMPQTPFISQTETVMKREISNGLFRVFQL